MHRRFSIELVGTDALHSREEPFVAHSASFSAPTESSEHRNEFTKQGTEASEYSENPSYSDDEQRAASKFSWTSLE